MTNQEPRLWNSPIAHAIDDFLDNNSSVMEVDDVNVVYLAQRIIEIAYLQKQINQNKANREMLEEMIATPQGEDNEANV